MLVTVLHREITPSVTGSWGKGSPVSKATAAMLSFYQAETGEWSREAVRGG